MDNPFVHDRPLDERRGFCNRRSEITRVASRIGADRPQSVSIVAEPRAGKTSLLNWLRDAESRTEYLEDTRVCVFLYLDLGADSAGTPEAFFQQLSLAWEAGGGERFAPTFDGFNGMVKGLMAEGRKLLLFLDDFGRVTQNSAFPLGFFSFMRSVANSNDVGYVTTSTTDLQKLCHTQDIEESPFFNIFTTVHLEPFTEKDARGLVTTLAADVGELSAHAVDWIVALAGGSPYLLQLVGGHAVELRRQDLLSHEALLEAVYGAGRDYLGVLWEDHMTSAQRSVLQAVQTGQDVDRRHEYAAELLTRRGHLVANEAGYGIRSQIMDRFVADSASGGFWKRIFS